MSLLVENSTLPSTNEYNVTDNKDVKYKERYELNKKLIDFDNIPDVLKNIFIKKYKNIL